MPTDEDKSRNTITLTPELAAAAAANPGYQLTLKAARALAVARIPWNPRCVTDLWYEDYGLYAVKIDSTWYYSAGSTGTRLNNLNDFREPLERAASFGMGVSFGIMDDKMCMLHLYPCKCPCDE